MVWGTKLKVSTASLDEDALAVRQPDHISDLLRPLPGVDVGGAHSLNQRITIRGMDDKDLNITIDGARQNAYMYHHMGNLQIHADILKSVDLKVGKNSVVHGGLGGDVAFETKDAADLLRDGHNFGARLLAGYADNASDSYSLAAYGQVTPKLDFLAYFNRVDRDNYAVGGDTITDSDGTVIPGTDGKVRGHSGEVADQLIKFGWNQDANRRLELSYENYGDEGNYSYRPDMGLATDLAIADNLGLPLTYPTEFNRETVNLNYDAYLGDGLRMKASAYRNQSDLERDESGVAAVFGGAALISGTATNDGARLQFTSVVDFGGASHQFNYGADIVRYETEYRQDRVPASAEQADNLAFYLEDRMELSDRVTFIPGIRYDQADLESAVVDDSFSGLTGSLALEWRFHRDWRLNLAGTSLFQAPEIGEVFIGAGIRDQPNPNINEETGANYEVGLAYRSDLNNGAIKGGVTLYQTQVDDYIYDYAPLPAGGRGKNNVGDMQLDGFEAYLGFDIGPWAMLLSASGTESELNAFDTYAALEGARLDRSQGDDYALSLDYRLPLKGLSIHWDSQYVDDVAAGLNLDGATLNNAKDSYDIHNISFRWAPVSLDGLAVTVGVDNLLDAYYASQASRTGISFHPRFGELYLVDYEPGRNIKTTLAYRF